MYYMLISYCSTQMERIGVNLDKNSGWALRMLIAVSVSRRAGAEPPVEFRGDGGFLRMRHTKEGGNYRSDCNERYLQSFVVWYTT